MSSSTRVLAIADSESIYKQIGPGERTALSKIAVEHLEKCGRSLRLAIDISIWQFQIQSGQGGKNPALRTLYYRLLRLLALSIHPLFVFDGPHKPPFKRGKKISPYMACLPNYLTKQLLKQFGFPSHTAPGEAEAECALLQREGIVDAVLSEDVDILMFGCSVSMRSWTAEGVRGNKSPTHVNVYRAETTEAKSGLNSEGMILVALMSGGDYIQAGIPGCGIKTACEAAKAGFGYDLCSLAKNDGAGIKQWRERLEYELQTNESKFFKQKHKTLEIPETFPDPAILGYYTHPAVSSKERVTRLRDEIQWDLEVNISDLRMFVAEAFDWQHISGAKKFIRGLAPALLAHQLVKSSMLDCQDDDDLEARRSAEAKLVKAICGRRIHWNTDGQPELRIAYIPLDTVRLDLELEERYEFQGSSQDVSGDEQPLSEGEETRDRSRSPTKKRAPSAYDPTEFEKLWVLETHVKLGAPLLVETWEEEMRNPKQFATRKSREKKASSKNMKQGGMDQYVCISKPGIHSRRAVEQPSKPETKTKITPVPVFLGPSTATVPASLQRKALSENRNPIGPKVSKKEASNSPKEPKIRNALSVNHMSLPSLKDNTEDPCTLAKSIPQGTAGLELPTQHDAPKTLAKMIGHSKQLASHPTSPSTKRRSRPTTPLSDAEGKQGFVHDRKTAQPKPTLSIPNRQDPTKPSPRKNRSALQKANDHYLAGQLCIPTSIRTERRRAVLDESPTTEPLTDDEPLTPQEVNRKINFAATPGPASPSSDSSSLPSPSTFLSPPPALAQSTDKDPTPPPKAKSPLTKEDGARRLVAPRESLEGAWKHMEPWEANAGLSRRIYRSVEVLDLTGGD